MTVSARRPQQALRGQRMIKPRMNTNEHEWGTGWRRVVVLVIATSIGACGKSPTAPANAQIRAEAEEIANAGPSLVAGRTIRFPVDRSMGEFRTWTHGSTSIPSQDARGEVSAPAGWHVQLQLSPEACADLSPLAELEADAIDELIFPVGHVLDESQLVHIRGLTGLPRIMFIGNQIGDGALEHLSGLIGLVYLTLHGSRVTNDGLTRLRSLDRLESLTLDSTRISDEGLAHLAELDSLETLSLDFTEVTDEGLKQLARIETLAALYLSGTRVTDAGLIHLAGLKNLRRLVVIRTDVTRQGVARLKRSLPECEILYNSPAPTPTPLRRPIS